MIIRTLPTKDFTVIRNATLSDSRLSWGARGLLTYLISLPPNWEINVWHLISESKGRREKNQREGGRDYIYARLKELDDCGYIVRERKPTAKGYQDCEYTLHEPPVTGYPDKAIPHEDYPDEAVPDKDNPHINKTNLNKELTSNNKTVRESECANAPLPTHSPNPILENNNNGNGMSKDRFHYSAVGTNTPNTNNDTDPTYKSAQAQERPVDRTTVKPKSKKAVKTQVPEDFEVTEALRSWAEKNDVTANLDKECVKFVAHYRANGDTRANWIATFQKWLTNDIATNNTLKRSDKNNGESITNDGHGNGLALISTGATKRENINQNYERRLSEIASRRGAIQQN